MDDEGGPRRWYGDSLLALTTKNHGEPPVLVVNRYQVFEKCVQQSTSRVTTMPCSGSMAAIQLMPIDW